MFLIPILFTGLIIWLFVYLINSASHREVQSGRNSSSKTPLDILNERYARGEIADEEYQRIKRNLQG